MRKSLSAFKDDLTFDVVLCWIEQPSLASRFNVATSPYINKGQAKQGQPQQPWIDIDGPESVLQIKLTDYVLTNDGQCGKIEYSAETALETSPGTVDSSYNLFGGATPLARIEGTTITFNSIKTYRLGVLKVKIKVRNSIELDLTKYAYID